MYWEDLPEEKPSFWQKQWWKSCPNCVQYPLKKVCFYCDIFPILGARKFCKVKTKKSLRWLKKKILRMLRCSESLCRVIRFPLIRIDQTSNDKKLNWIEPIFLQVFLLTGIDESALNQSWIELNFMICIFSNISCM